MRLATGRSAEAVLATTVGRPSPNTAPSTLRVCHNGEVPDTVNLRREVLTRIMATVQELGSGQDVDDVLELIARAVVDVIGFDAVAVNVRTRHGDLAVRIVVGPPEMEQLRGGTMSHDGWLHLLDSGTAWGELRFLREPDLDESVPHLDPWQERIDAPRPAGSDDPLVEPWQPEFALLAPMWRAPGELLGVISVDLPRSGLTPDAEQRTLLELFTGQAGAAIKRVHAFDVAADTASLYRAAFSASPSPTAVLDDRLRIAEANSAFHDLADAVDGEPIDRPLAELVDIGDERHIIAHLAELPSGRSTVVADECRLHHPRGQDWDRWVHIAIQRVDALTGYDRYICSVTDRTAARAAMTEMRHIAETMNSPVCRCARSVYANWTAARTHWPPDTPPWSRCCTAIWTTSRRSTTRTDTSPAMSCWSRSPAECVPPPTTATSYAAGVVTNSVLWCSDDRSPKWSIWRTGWSPE